MSKSDHSRSSSSDRSSRVQKHAKIYVFRCGTTALLALTANREGQNLPREICGPIGWIFEKSVTVPPEKSVDFNESTRATMAAIAKHGFYLTHAAIHSLPLDHSPHQQKRTPMKSEVTN